MLVRHVLGFLTLTFFVVVASKTKPLTFAQVMGLSGFFYAWFVLSTRMHLHFWFMVISLVGAIYLIHLYQSDLTSDTPTEEEQQKFNMIKEILAITAGVVTLLGFLSYLGEKKIEYKGGFKFEKFLLGAPSCRSKTPKVGFFDSLRGVFR
jgi:NADH:ubiquinone oxidoreductase subunit 6 (subunit J)